MEIGNSKELQDLVSLRLAIMSIISAQSAGFIYMEEGLWLVV